MSDDLARRSHAIFMEALDLEPARQDEFVRRSCIGDATLQARVLQLIAAVRQSTGFLEQPALSAPVGGRDVEAVVAPASIQVMGYRPVRVLGVGGMATVYEAVQHQPERTVALKVMNRWLDSDSAVRRFRYETEVLARLHHPGIAQIYEAGTCEDGSGRPLPFFAMELIPRARTITEHADGAGLSVRRRVELLAGVCDAVQHGHQLGVIHRDLKPGNILVDEAGRTRVIDFGIARRLDPGGAAVTEGLDTAQLIGTLNYMSPEQCGAAPGIDARTDVYGLGVVLFELVAGRLPHDLSGMPIPLAVREIAEREAPRASRFRADVPRDLDAIIAKAISKNRVRRYSGADALASDIRRFLQGHPVEARQAGSLEVLLKMARRNRPLTAAVVMLVLTMVAGITVSSWYAYAAGRARDAAVERGRELEAVTAFQESLLRGVDAASMGDRLRLAIEAQVRRAAGDGGEAEVQAFGDVTAGVNFTSVAIRTLDQSVLQRHRRAIEERFKEQPRLQARLLQQLADTMNSLGLYAEAEPVLRQALALRRGVLGDRHEDTLQTIHALGSLMSTLGRQDESLELLHEASERRAAAFGPEDQVALRYGVSLGGAYRRKGDLKSAERIWGDVLAAQRRTLGHDAADTLRTLNNMGVVLASQGRSSEAEACWREMLDHLRRKGGEDDPRYLSSLGNLGVILQDQGKYEEARRMMEQALASDRRRFGDLHSSTLVSAAQLAALLDDMTLHDDAERLARECYDGRLSLLGAQSAATLQAGALLGFIMHNRGEREQSETIVRRALEEQRRLFGPGTSESVQSMQLLHRMIREKGALVEAIDLGHSALALAREHLPDQPWLIGEVLAQLGVSLIAADKIEEAREPLLEGYKLLEGTFGPGNKNAVDAATGLVKVYAHLHRQDPRAGHDAEAARWEARAKKRPGPATR